MKKIFTLLAALALWSSEALAQNEIPAVSKAPHAAMEKLSVLTGDWLMTAEYSADDGQTWSKGEPEHIKLSYRQKNLMLHEVPMNTDRPGFHTEIFIAYDQYRKLYRLIAVDDAWGLPDVYEGKLEDGKLVVTNLKSGTFFPMDENVWRGFRITLELNAAKRMMVVDKTDDNGKSWQPNFRITYVKQ